METIKTLRVTSFLTLFPAVMTCTNCGFTLAEEGNDLHSRLSKLDAIIASLTAERQRLQAESDAIVYPILSLPTEITTEIFRRWCVLRSRSRPYPSEGPLLLAQICHQWRQIALHTPELWRDLHFTDRSSVELFKLWLDRSRDLSLNLAFDSWDIALTGRFIEASMVHSHRWQVVELNLPIVFYTTLDLSNVSLPILHSISLKNYFSGERTVGAGTVLNAPLLREAHIHTFPDLKVDFLRPKLTSLTLQHAIDLTKCIILLRGCPDLVKLALSTSGQGPVQTDSLVLPALESLECDLTAASILEHLTLPRLQRLRVTETETDVPQHTVLQNFIRRSACPLGFLSIENPGTTDTLTSCLIAVSDSVSDLEVTRGRPGHLLAALKLVEVLPRLKILRAQFQGNILSDTDYQDFIDTVRMRLSPTPPRVALEGFTLHTFQYGNRRMPSAAILVQFRELAAIGLKIKFTTRMDQRSSSITRVVLDSWTE
ncbi:hypothetical protein B0H16DRAFT_235406 [Mycena metata]|uniref:F-box domain-containing protein n=1 Tax=Mycena metata TaxID=1033252 RepID=A0AAD7JUN4_9AGAR|nr:hypothetical protein B0H16DRAFT_235406 [Mycena metata]